ncbi:MAG: signal peptidase I [Deltaproteobacteria bacterium]|nr:signal peptidase I [Deltaproteobacteria bacterium]
MKTKSKIKLRSLMAGLLLPGLGQVRNRQYGKAVTVFSLFAFSLPAFTLLSYKLPHIFMSPAIASGALISVGSLIFGLYDSVKNSTRYIESENRHFPIWLFFIIVAVGYLVILNPLRNYIQHNLVEAFYIPSKSMEPNLQAGDYIFVDKHYNTPGAQQEIKRGDIVVFINPDNRNQFYIKRVIGLPGETVTINNTTVSVDGKPITHFGLKNNEAQTLTEEISLSGRKYSVLWKSNKNRTWVQKIPSGHIAVLGDNRDDAKDSRLFGPIPLQNVIGIAKQIWFSKAVNGTQRIGTWLDPNR